MSSPAAPYPIPSDHLPTCKLGQASLCCRYLVGAEHGLSCAKATGMRAYIDQRVGDGTVTARGDNCDGLTADD